ncbi:MAG: glycosyltransferase family 4 protein [Methanobacteriaceae archaeon]|nr:glycosyltransferase family 4 protein [Methanobacteriaceae archaeon]
MRIAFIYDAAYPWVTGGAEVRVYELARRLAGRGHDVHWYTIGWWWTDETQDDIIRDGIKFHGVCKPTPIYSGSRRSIKEAIYFSLKLLRPLFKKNFDIIDCQGFPFFSSFIAWFHSLLGRSKLVITVLEVWGSYWYEYIGFLGIFGRFVEFLTLHLSNNIISISPKTKRDFLKVRRISQVQLITPGINISDVEKIKGSERKQDILFAGRLIKEKRVKLLIESLIKTKEDIPNIKCLIVGEGPEKEHLVQLTQKLGLEKNVEFLGFMKNHPDLMSLMKSSRVLVLPSKREGFGMVVVEANASGIPAIVVEDPMNAACDLVEEGVNGFIAQPTPQDLSKKIKLTLEKGQSLREDCLSHAQPYDWNRLTLTLEQFYGEVLK